LEDIEMGFFDFLFKTVTKPKCTPEYIRERKAELIEQEHEKTRKAVILRAICDSIIAARNGIPEPGDLMHDGRYGTYWVVVKGMYKGYVIGTEWYHEWHNGKEKLKSIMYDGVWELSDLHFEKPHEYYDVPRLMTDREFRRLKFEIDIKHKPWDVWYNLPEDEKKAIERLPKECEP
jgi:hypothetical protein